MDDESLLTSDKTFFLLAYICIRKITPHILSPIDFGSLLKIQMHYLFFFDQIYIMHHKGYDITKFIYWNSEQ